MEVLRSPLCSGEFSGTGVLYVTVNAVCVWRLRCCKAMYLVIYC